MIISDLNYLEVANEVAVVGGGRGFDYKKNLDIKVDSNVDLNFDSYTDIDFKKNTTITSDIDLKGNSATFVFDAEAIGSDTDSEVVISALAVEGKLSSLAGSVVVAAD
ncbi:hypothetical protein WA1_40160 [Scytonema hofmannii PCC 7110]|uniref:Uncharacterized protein n=1 Tax=Scytonema hofmannii PCC 7110 TaxID=128403 RepID=A0A139WYY8_9CYAN|nr:hypothetical protein [Scytonema hofmannii]KYC37677.1 hypothetical protein WA1_40160 [Scytonema hofmannii PCC 7110]